MSKFIRKTILSLLLSSLLFLAAGLGMAQRFTYVPMREPISSLVAIMPGHRLLSSDEYETRTASCVASASGIDESLRLYASARFKKGEDVIHVIESVWGNWPNVVPLEWPLFALKGHLNQFANVQWGSNRAEIGMEGNYDIINDRGEPIGPVYVKAACRARW